MQTQPRIGDLAYKFLGTSVLIGMLSLIGCSSSSGSLHFSYSVSGTVSGLAGSGLVLQDNGDDNLAVSANGPFTFSNELAADTSYNVTVFTQPTNPSQTCVPTSSTGTSFGNISNVLVTCTTNASTVGGTVSGLAGSGLVLQENGGNNLAVSANGSFTFTNELAAGTAYSVTVFTQPTNPSQTCVPTVNTGTGTSSNVTNVLVVCTNALSGQYAFVLTGFDSTGNPMSMAGSFKADGLGHVTAGALDVNDNGVPSSSSSLAGSYVFDANGLGALGTVTLTSTVGTIAHPLAFGFALQAGGGFGDIMSLDANDFIVTGTMQKQDSSVFSLTSLAGDYIITLNGRNAAAPTSALGRFTLGASGASTNVLFDRSVAGVGAAGPPSGASAVITFASAGPDTNGRGTFTVTLTDGLPNSGTQQKFDYYAITANRIVAVEDKDSTGGTMIADGSRQTLTAITANTTGSVFGVAGVDTTKSNEIAAVGQLQIPGPGQTAGALIFDSNDDGAIAGPTNLAIQQVTFDINTGRGTFAATNGFSNGLFDSAVFYLTASGTGFILDTEAGISNRAMAGTLSTQSGSPFALSTISGQMILRTRGSSVNDALSLVGLIVPTTTSGVYAIGLDQRVPTTVAFGPFATVTDAVITNVTAVTLDSSTGRGTISIPTATSNGTPTTATEVFYVIGLNQMVFIDVSPVSSGVNGASSLFFVNPY